MKYTCEMSLFTRIAKFSLCVQASYLKYEQALLVLVGANNSMPAASYTNISKLTAITAIPPTSP